MPVSHSSELIALVSLTWNAKSYDPGDRFQPKLLPHQRRTVDRMVNAASRKLGELTAANMAIALERRPREAGIPAGFTLAGLLGLNLITEEQVQKFGWGEPEGDDTEQQQEQQQQEPKARPDWLAADTEAYDVDDLWVVRQKSNGGPPRYDVLDAKGDRVFTGGTIAGKDNAIKKAQAFIDARPPVEEPEPLFPDFPESLDDWSDDQKAEFKTWFDGLPQDDTQYVLSDAAGAYFKELREGGGDDDAEAEEARAELEAVAEANLTAMDADGLRAWLKDRDMHAPADSTEDQMREAAEKLRDAAAEQLKALKAPETSEGTQDGGDVQPGSGQPA